MTTTLDEYADKSPGWDAPVIIESHINGVRVQEMNPHLPMTHEEIAQDAIDCLDAGACAVHAHNTNYDLKAEAAFLDYKRSWDTVFARHPDALLYGTTCAVGLLSEHEHGLEHVEILHERYGSKLGVVDAGILNLALGADESGDLYGVAHGYNLRRLNEQVHMLRRNDMGVIFSVIEPGFLRYALHCERRGILPAGSSLDLYLMGDYGMVSMEPMNTAGVPATLESLYFYLDMMRDSRLPWFLSVWGAGDEAEVPLIRRAIELGGHIKVGLELHYDPVRKPTNVELLQRAQDIAREVGRPLATPADAKQILGI